MPGRVFRRDTADATPHAGVPPDRGAGRSTAASRSPTSPARSRRSPRPSSARDFTLAAAAVVLPVHRAVGRVRHPAPRRLVARARRLRHGPPQRAAQLRHRPRGVERLRVRLRHRPAAAACATASTTSARCSPTTSASWSSSDDDVRAPVLAHEFAPVGDDVDALARAAERPRPGGRRRRSRSASRSTASSWREVLALAAHPDADTIQLVDVDAGDGEALQIVVRRVQHGGRRPRAAGDGRHDDAGRHEDRAAQDARRVVERHALLAARARPRRRPRRHLDPPARPARSGAPLCEALGVEPTSCSTSRSPATAPTPMSHAGVARDLRRSTLGPAHAARPGRRGRRALDRRRS